MRSLPRIALPLLIVGGLVATAAGCATPANTPISAGSAQSLTVETGRAIDRDFEPLASPSQAVRLADLIVVGTVLRVSQGITVEYRDGSVFRRDVGEYATFEVRVDRVLSDRRAASARTAASAGAGRLAETIYVAVGKNVGVTPQRLDALNPQAQAVLVLQDRASTATPRVKVVRPATIAPDAPLFMPYSDGIWLQGPADHQMYGVYSTWQDLAPGWHAANTVQRFADQIESAVQVESAVQIESTA